VAARVALRFLFELERQIRHVSDGTRSLPTPTPKVAQFFTSNRKVRSPSFYLGFYEKYNRNRV
jgi:hypothetical protein